MSKPAAAVAAYLDPIHAEILAKDPAAAGPRERGLLPEPALADDDETRARYRVASGLAALLGYDFVKLATIERKRFKARAMDELVAGLPEGATGVAEAKEAMASQWLCRQPSAVRYPEKELLAESDRYLQRHVSTEGTRRQRALALLDVFVAACTFGVPEGQLKPLRDTSRLLYKDSAKVAELTGLPFEKLARIEGADSPLLLYNFVRTLPADFQGRDAALQATHFGEWTYPPR